MEQLIQQFPKVELHTHLNGCIREETLNRWHSDKHVTEYIDSFLSPSTNSKEALSNCFKSFDLIYEATTTLDRIRTLATEVLEDYDKDNAIIVEIRTTPRALEGHSLRDYIDTVIDAFNKYTTSRSKTTPFHPYLLLSVNRSRLGSAKETIELAAEYMKKTPFVRGVELSGNPFVGTWQEIVPLFNHARSLGLPITMHIAEKKDDEEAMKLLECGPSRVGHGIFMPVQAIEYMNKNGIGCEVCLTSNMVSRSIPAYNAHPIASNKAYTGNIYISCDDRGLFRTSMVKELEYATQSYCSTDEERVRFIKDQCLRGISASFVDSETKESLLHYVQTYINEHKEL